MAGAASPLPTREARPLQNLQRRSAFQAGGQKDPTRDGDAKKRFEREIDGLAAAIQRFRIDVQRFFGGELKIPPEELRDQIPAELRRLQTSKLAGSAEKFRLGSLEAQFNSHLELHGRRMREREQGESLRRREVEEKPDPAAGVVIGPQPGAGAVEALYQAMYLRSGTPNPQIDLERFRTHLTRQAETIRAKTGCTEIKFRVAEEDGKVKIKARPMSAKART